MVPLLVSDKDTSPVTQSKNVRKQKFIYFKQKWYPYVAVFCGRSVYKILNFRCSRFFLKIICRLKLLGACPESRYLIFLWIFWPFIQQAKICGYLFHFIDDHVQNLKTKIQSGKMNTIIKHVHQPKPSFYEIINWVQITDFWSLINLSSVNHSRVLKKCLVNIKAVKSITDIGLIEGLLFKASLDIYMICAVCLYTCLFY